MNFRFVSDVDTINGKPAVEWDDMQFGRHWQTFANETEMKEALDRNEAYNLANKDIINAMRQIEADNEMHALLVEYETNPAFASEIAPSLLARIEEYKTVMMAERAV